MNIFPVDWVGVDLPTAHEIRCFGKLEDGRSTCVRISFCPFFYVACPSNWSPSRAKLFIAEEALGKLQAVQKYTCVLRRKTMWGFTNSEPRLFCQLAFPTVDAAKKAQRNLTDRLKMQTYEASLDSVIRLFHVRDLAPAQWVHVASSATPVPAAQRVTCTDVEVMVGFEALSPAKEMHAVPPVVLASFDIECISESGGFPLAEQQNDVICTICTTFQRYGASEPFLRHAVTLGTCAEVDGVLVVQCETEAEVINAWLEALHANQADFLVGWNTLGFDYRYIYGRSLICVDDATGEPLVDMERFGRSLTGGGVPVQKQLSSSAYGDNSYFHLKSHGWIHVDAMQIIKKEHKLDSYSLNAVAEKFLGDRKLDLKPYEIFERYRGSAEDRAVITRYCAKDTELPLRILERLSIVQNLLEMANAVSVPVDYLITRGQQIKVFSLLLKKARSLGFLCPDMNRSHGSGDSGDKYEGATVLAPQRGAYLNDIVSGLDFASLYPSIIRAHNFCPSTLVIDPRYANLNGVTYHVVETPVGTYTFAQDVPSVLPALLNDLAAFRKDAKKEMALEKERGNLFGASVQNSKQLAYKISMNSAYGFFGAQKGFLPCLPLASAVTTTGRLMISETKRLVEEMYPGSRVVYGDSVMPYTPILVKDAAGVMSIQTISNIAEGWTAYEGFKMFETGLSEKEQAHPTGGLLAWTHQGWATIKRVIRHKCAKRIYRVLTHTGLVDVTEDHSLLDSCVQQVKPGDATVGMELLHRIPTFSGTVPEISVEQAQCYGFMVGDGSCGVYEYAEGRKHSWAFNNSDRGLLETYKSLLEKVHGMEFKIYDTLASSGVYKLCPFGGGYGGVKSLVTHYREKCYDGECKKVPLEVLFGSLDVKNAFLKGLWDSDGCRADYENIGCHRLDTKNQITAQYYFMLLHGMGCNVSINDRKDKDAVFRLTFTNSKQRRNPNAIKKIYILHEEYRGYVYDIETEAGVFQAGVGGLIVKNTDSVMVIFNCGPENRTNMQAHFEMAQRAADAITGHFKKPNELEFEKCYFPYLLFSKKRYAGMMYTKPDAPDYLDAKGLQLVRRDNCPLVRTVSSDILETIMRDKSAEMALLAAKKHILSVLENEADLKAYIVSKALRSEYKNPDSQPHLQVARKIHQRRGYPVPSGERVPFVFVEDMDNPDGLQASRAEDPEYVTAHNLVVDRLHYLESQLTGPIETLLDVLQPGTFASLMASEDIKPLVDALTERRKQAIQVAKRRRVNARNNQQEITSFFAFRG